MSDTQTWQNFISTSDVEAIADVPDQTSIAIQPQYAHAPIFKAFMKIFQDEVDATPQLEQVLQFIADPDTCVGVFLDWMGERVGISRTLTQNGVTTSLDDETFRFLVMYKALANVSDASAYTMNVLLSKLLGMQVWVIDNLDMTVDVRILGSPTDFQVQVLEQYGLLNRGAGVGYNILIQDPNSEILGFNGSGLQPFNQGVFNPATSINPIEQG